MIEQVRNGKFPEIVKRFDKQNEYYFKTAFHLCIRLFDNVRVRFYVTKITMIRPAALNSFFY